MFSHEKLDAYRVAIEYAKWAFLISKKLTTENRHSKDHMLRASQSIPLNIAEGNGRSTEADRRHFFEISRGSAMECAAIQDLLEACGALEPDENVKGKELLERIVAMLTKMAGRGYAIKEDVADY